MVKYLYVSLFRLIFSGGNKMKKTNDYPIILIHGFLCWGTESKINQFMPCMGMWNGNARVAIMEEGQMFQQCPVLSGL